MKNCFVLGCDCKSASKGIFLAPKDLPSYILWKKAVGTGRDGKVFSRKDSVCHQHFRDEEVIKGREVGGEFFPYFYWRLKAGAVPSIKLSSNNIYICALLKKVYGFSR